MSGEEVISVRDLLVTFRNSSRSKSVVKAVDHVSLSLRRGDSLALVGESGSGKTTTAMAIMSLLKPSGGEINYNFTDSSVEINAEKRTGRKELTSLWKKMSIVFQDPYSSLDPRMLIKDIIIEPFVGHKFGNSEKGYKKAEKLILDVGLKKEHLNVYPHQLSGGQRQRVNIARALITDPEVIIFDEPTSSLDVSVQAKILNVIIEKKKSQGLTYLFITHNLLVAEKISNHTAVLFKGVVMEMGDTESLFRDPLHPYTQLLLSSIPTTGEKLTIRKFEEDISDINIPTMGCVFHNRCEKATRYCGWNSYEVAEKLSSELYLSEEARKGMYEFVDDLHLKVLNTNESFHEAREILQDYKELFHYKDITVGENQIDLYLYEPWKPELREIKDGRKVSCILFDESATEKIENN